MNIRLNIFQWCIGMLMLIPGIVHAQPIQDRYARLVEYAPQPDFVDMSPVRTLWKDGVTKDIYHPDVGGLKNLCKSLLLGYRPYSKQLLYALISVPALQLIAFTQKKYGHNQPYDFVTTIQGPAWEYPRIDQYVQPGNKVIPITYYSLLNAIIEMIGQIEADLAHGTKLYEVEKNYFDAARQTLSTNLDIAWQGMQQAGTAVFDVLARNSDQFNATNKFHTTHNRIRRIAGNDATQKLAIAQQSAYVWPITDQKVVTLLEKFLDHKRRDGTAKEQAFYSSTGMNVQAEIDRMIKNRPLSFINANDSYRLRSGQQDAGGFDQIGTMQERYPLELKEYMSYDEMAIAALFGLSGPTFFINDGSRNNAGKTAPAGTYEEQGIYIGLVGARFERPGLMEWAHMIVTPQQNTVENGYGKHNKNFDTPKKRLLALWQEFYGYQFATYDEAVRDTSGRFIKVGSSMYLDVWVYKERMRIVLNILLAEANSRGYMAHKKVYCHVVGLGMGVWMVDERQAHYLIEVCAEILAQRPFLYLSDIDFSWFPSQYTTMGGVPNGGTFTKGGNTIAVHFSNRNPAAKLSGADANKLLVASYAWDGNAYPGNEYWMGSLTASGDPTAACCSTIGELHNALINLRINAQNLVLVSS